MSVFIVLELRAVAVLRCGVVVNCGFVVLLVCLLLVLVVGELRLMWLGCVRL